jgi:hypothetical protein
MVQSSLALFYPCCSPNDRASKKKVPLLRDLRAKSELFGFFLGGMMDDFFAIVIAAFRANVMGFDHCAAMRASNQAGHFELKMSSP